MGWASRYVQSCLRARQLRFVHTSSRGNSTAQDCIVRTRSQKWPCISLAMRATRSNTAPCSLPLGLIQRPTNLSNSAHPAYKSVGTVSRQAIARSERAASCYPHQLGIGLKGVISERRRVVIHAIHSIARDSLRQRERGFGVWRDCGQPRSSRPAGMLPRASESRSKDEQEIRALQARTAAAVSAGGPECIYGKCVKVEP